MRLSSGERKFPKMRLLHNIDLGYCTNIHRGETWEETFHGLAQYTNEVRERVSADRPYGIGLRLSALAANQLRSDAAQLTEFQKWLERTNSYVFTINGFPYGTFHGSRVKEQVYVPDWATKERLEYTTLLFDLLDEIAPAGQEISVSTLPGSFKEFISPETDSEQFQLMRSNLSICSEHIEKLRETSGREIHLGMEPEPLGYFETSGETVQFFNRVHESLSDSESERFARNVGVNYDTCHLAVEFEPPSEAISRLRAAGIRISKIHLSSALALRPEESAIRELESFQDDVYLHQVVVGKEGEVLQRFRDLPDALDWYSDIEEAGDEWRVHFHIPLHSPPAKCFQDTRDHIEGVLLMLAEDPGWCSHFEMETYTWEVLPPEMRSSNVIDQLEAEYKWCLEELSKHGLA